MKTFFLSFYVKPDKANKTDGCVPIYARLTVKGKPVTFYTGYNIMPEIWKRTNRLLVPKTDAEKKLQKNLTAFEHDFEEIVQRKKIANAQFTAASLKEARFKKEQPPKEYYLSDALKLWFDTFGEKIKAGNRTIGSLNKYKATKGHVTNFLSAKYHKEDIKLADINYEFISKFDLYLRNTKEIGNNSTVKYIRFLRAVNNLAVKYGWTTPDAFKLYEGKIIEEQTIYLTEQEILKIQNHKFSYPRLQIVADIFTFCCYTGYAPVDLENLTWDNIRLHSDGQYWVFTERIKTGIKANVPLLPPALQILERYKNNSECTGNSLFPSKRNQKQNTTLKLIQEVCTLDKTLTCYVSRHSFACLMLSKNIPLPVVSEMMGHKRIVQTQHYAKVLQSSVGSAMKTLSQEYLNNPTPVEKAA